MRGLRASPEVRFPQIPEGFHSLGACVPVRWLGILEKLQQGRHVSCVSWLQTGVACATLEKLQCEQESLPVAVWPAP